MKHSSEKTKNLDKNVVGLKKNSVWSVLKIFHKLRNNTENN